MSRRQGKRAWKLLEHPKFRLLMTCWPCELKLNVTLNCSVCEMVGGVPGFRATRSKRDAHELDEEPSPRRRSRRPRKRARVVRVPHDSGVYCHRQQSGLPLEQVNAALKALGDIPESHILPFLRFTALHRWGRKINPILKRSRGAGNLSCT